MTVNTIIIDMYGVILKERTGNFLPYTYEHFDKSHHERINKLIYEEGLFTKAGYGEITSNEFLLRLEYEKPERSMRDYIENHLTLDESFIHFAEKYYLKYDFVLLSTDVSEWSKYITEYYKLDKYFTHKIVSGDVHLRKPDKAIFELTLKRIGRRADECLFIDDSIANLQAAEELGIKTVHFNRFGEYYDGISVISFDEITNMLFK